MSPRDTKAPGLSAAVSVSSMSRRTGLRPNKPVSNCLQYDICIKKGGGGWGVSSVTTVQYRVINYSQLVLIHMYVLMYMYILLNMYIHIYSSIYEHTCVQHTCMYVHIYSSTHKHTCVQYTCMYMYLCSISSFCTYFSLRI